MSARKSVRADTPGLFIVPAGSLAGTTTEQPRANIHFASRAPWYTHAASLETFDEMAELSASLVGRLGA